ncbi:transglutaminase N-terminal domain-containing protein [Streptacidiphilus monticola]
MGSRLRIRHVTRVGYAAPASSSYNELRMTPPTLPTQTVLDARVTVKPHAPVWSYWDYWGTQVSVFDLPEQHTVLEVEAGSLVETAPPAPLAAPPSRELIAAEAADSRLTEYLSPTPRTTVPDRLAALARQTTAGLDAHEAAAAVVDLVRGRVTYTPEAPACTAAPWTSGSRGPECARTSPT